MGDYVSKTISKKKKKNYCIDMGITCFVLFLLLYIFPIYMITISIYKKIIMSIKIQLLDQQQQEHYIVVHILYVHLLL